MADAQQVRTGLEAWLRARGRASVVTVTGRATVGLSQETWFVEVADVGADPVAGVLRLPTPASGDKAIVTQRAAMQAVATAGVLAPELLWHDDGDDNPFGRPFLVMRRVTGAVPAGWSDVSEPARTGLAEQAIDALATLHAVDPTELEASGNLASGTADLDRYRRRLERVDRLPPVLRGALWWLERHAPAPDGRRALVHGDFRMGNFVVDDDRLVAVLDWEMASAGDPLADLAWCFIPVWEPTGLDEAAMVRRYAARTGAPVDERRLHWHRVLAYVRLAYYGLSGAAAFDRGRSDDLRLAALRLQLPVHLDRLAATIAGRPVT